MIRLAITLGDPAGVGPEIILRLWESFIQAPEQLQYSQYRIVPFVVGEARHLNQIARMGAVSEQVPNLVQWKPEVAEAVLVAPESFVPEAPIPVMEPTDFDFPGELEMGKISKECGAAAWAYVRHAVALVQAGQADAIVTAPLHKEALKRAGSPFPGHTEMLSQLAGNVPVAMLLVGGGIRVALTTIHIPIVEVAQAISRELILRQIRMLHGFLPWFEAPDPDSEKAGPTIGVTGLNPHSSDGGLFGKEEAEIVEPAIEAARQEGIEAIGPLPADTAFFFHREGNYDGILAMYHDQALIPVKTLAFHDGVNVTMGLPFIRTSVDHGTAFDIAGQGIARPDSLRAAFFLGARLAVNRLLHEEGRR
ncbi:MAG: 4-hydroxythreonine-4-phosphate dehydrogenase PdxA [Candidatus Sumerlaeota bacterium]